ncbi:YidH family protein [Streptomyces sp. NPDC087270]|uniref:YidH family protein n=1 Tax=Streptomyces sp. NPDC087270 TaxID=3365774 RepID=UPI00381B27B2
MAGDDDPATGSGPDDAHRSTAEGAWWERGEEPDYRATLANERTLLAWSRTALALLAASFVVVNLTVITPRALRLALGAYLVALSGGVTVTGYVQWRVRQARMRHRLPLGRVVSPPVLTAALLVLAGFVVAVIVIAS